MFKPGEYKTKGGFDAVIYAVHNDVENGHYPIHGAYKTSNGWCLASWTTEGREYANALHNKNDLVEPEEWMNVYDIGVDRGFKSKTEADDAAGMLRIACVKVGAGL